MGAAMEIALWSIAIIAVLFLALRLLTAWVFRTRNMMSRGDKKPAPIPKE
jgi:hypothetical protein